MYVVEDIIEFVKEETAVREVNATDDLFNDLGCVGDDYYEFMQAYSTRFKVDMTAFLWYFHADEEGQNLGGVFFKPPYMRVEHIPVTPNLLLEFANKGKWEIDYPKHKLPKRRYDMLINYAIGFLLIAYVIYSCFRK